MGVGVGVGVGVEIGLGVGVGVGSGWPHAASDNIAITEIKGRLRAVRMDRIFVGLTSYVKADLDPRVIRSDTWSPNK